MKAKINSIKCPQCSLVNFTTAEACKRCDTPLIKHEDTSAQFAPELLQNTQNEIMYSGSMVEVTTQNEIVQNSKIPLIQCPTCDVSVSGQAASCPHCGQPLSALKSPLDAGIEISPLLGERPRRIFQSLSVGKIFAYGFAISTFLLIGFIIYQSRQSANASAKWEHANELANSVTTPQCEQGFYVRNGDADVDFARLCYLHDIKTNQPLVWEQLHLEAQNSCVTCYAIR